MQFKELGIADWAVEVDELPFGSEVAGVQCLPSELDLPASDQFG